VGNIVSTPPSKKKKGILQNCYPTGKPGYIPASKIAKILELVQESFREATEHLKKSVQVMQTLEDLKLSTVCLSSAVFSMCPSPT
jgi:hypothetical protein